MAEQGPVMRVDRGDGNLINMKMGEAKKFIAEHPGAKVVGPRPTHDDSVPTEQEIAATAAQTNTGPDLAKMRKPDLVKLAEERGLDTSGTAEDLRERLNAASQPEDRPLEELSDDELRELAQSLSLTGIESREDAITRITEARAQE